MAGSLLLTAVLTFATSAHADEVRLHDGRVLVGKVTKKANNTIQIETREGIVIVTANEIASQRDDDVLRKDLSEQAQRAGDTRFAHLNLAMQARAFGLEPEMWRHLDRAVQPDGKQASAALERSIADFLARLEPELLPRQFRTASTPARIDKLLAEVRADTSPGRMAAIEELLVREETADQQLRQQARHNPTPRQRIAALAALQRRELAGNHRFVLRSAFLDGSPDVRQAAVDIGRQALAADDVAYLANGLTHANAKVRERTADALGELGQPDAIKMLVMAGPHAAKGLAAGDGGQGVRANIAIVNQQAYIRDYDVEVAQAAFIADPKVDVLQSGTVLDVTVVGVIEERIIIQAYRRALKKLTRQDPGANPGTWATWLSNLQPAVAAPQTGKR